MEPEKKQGLNMLTKISIGINTLLFGITGIIYLIDGSMIIGYTLLAAGVVNILYLLFTVHTKNMVFVILNFLFAAVSLWVTFDYLSRNISNTGMLWGFISLVYLIIAFVLLIKVNNKKHKTSVE